MYKSQCNPTTSQPQTLKLKKNHNRENASKRLCRNCGTRLPPIFDEPCGGVVEESAAHAECAYAERTSFTPSADSAQVHTPPNVATKPDILKEFEGAIRASGVVGEERNAKLIYLALTSRVLDQPVSLAIKGVSSVGKSYTVESTLKFFPPSAFIAMTAMSERALVYMRESFSHRTIVLFEAVALREQREKAESNLTAYFVRSLLSEGRISYPVAVRDKEDGGWVTKTIVKEGPTNLLLTTTATSLHSENETRIISLPTNDTPQQTQAILLQLASDRPSDVNFEEWRDFQAWIETAEHRVVIPYARYLAQKMPPVAVRLRRDFKALLCLIESHAILHQLSRARDDRGRVVANEADYLAVRELVADLISEGVGATVPPSVRETVNCVCDIAGTEGATVQAVAAQLGLDRSAAQRRLQAARERGYIVNVEEKRGRPARYVIGDPTPDELQLLPASVQGVQLCPNSQGEKGQTASRRYLADRKGSNGDARRCPACDGEGCRWCRHTGVVT